MVDREIFSRRLEALRGYLRKLHAFAEAGEAEFVGEPALHDLAERYLHLAVEACLDLGNHWISDRSLPTPDTNRDTFTVLEKAGELAPDLAERLRGWAGFRNVLVHEYLQIDHAIAYRAIREELGDLERLASWAADRLAVQEPPGSAQ
jgi:uncharacterized protein YutE (UPF0331/DUF86 family)